MTAEAVTALPKDSNLQQRKINSSYNAIRTLPRRKHNKHLPESRDINKKQRDTQ